MRHLSAIWSVVMLTLGSVTHAHSEPITFEGLCAPNELLPVLPEGYDRLRWSNVGAVGRDHYKIGSGYAAVTRGEVAGFSHNHKVAKFSSKTPFSLIGGHFAAAWANQLQVTFSAYRDGVLMGTKAVLLDRGDTKLQFDPSFAHIDTVTIAGPKDVQQSDIGFDNLKVLFDR